LPVWHYHMRRSLPFRVHRRPRATDADEAGPGNRRLRRWPAGAQCVASENSRFRIYDWRVSAEAIENHTERAYQFGLIRTRPIGKGLWPGTDSPNPSPFTASHLQKWRSDCPPRPAHTCRDIDTRGVALRESAPPTVGEPGLRPSNCRYSGPVHDGSPDA
jgi:hypothetical protein